MPIEDAIILLTRNFEAYMKGEMFEKEGRMASLAEKHPEAIQVNKNLKKNEYIEFIKCCFRCYLIF